MRLKKSEIIKIGNWEPYKYEWKINRNLISPDDNINLYYGNLISSLTNNSKFKCEQTEDGGLSNFLEFICYEKKSRGDGIQVLILFINLCAPIATFGQTTASVWNKVIGYSYPKTEELGIIRNNKLSEIANELSEILKENSIALYDHNELNIDLIEGLEIKENLIEGKKMFNYLFQMID